MSRTVDLEIGYWIPKNIDKKAQMLAVSRIKRVNSRLPVVGELYMFRRAPAIPNKNGKIRIMIRERDSLPNKDIPLICRGNENSLYYIPQGFETHPGVTHPSLVAKLVEMELRGIASETCEVCPARHEGWFYVNKQHGLQMTQAIIKKWIIFGNLLAK